MFDFATRGPSSPEPRRRAVLLAGVAACASVACGSGEVQLPEPRRLVVHSGERLVPTKERMEEVDAWIREQWDSIQMDPSFMIYTEGAEGPVYPWESLELNEAGDTARIAVQGRSAGSQLYTIYAHYHLMALQDRLEKWLPEGQGADEFELEKAILSRVADVWLYQRSILDAPPYRAAGRADLRQGERLPGRIRTHRAARRLRRGPQGVLRPETRSAPTPTRSGFAAPSSATRRGREEAPGKIELTAARPAPIRRPPAPPGRRRRARRCGRFLPAGRRKACRPPPRKPDTSSRREPPASGSGGHGAAPQLPHARGFSRSQAQPEYPPAVGVVVGVDHTEDGLEGGRVGHRVLAGGGSGGGDRSGVPPDSGRRPDPWGVSRR